MRHVIDPVEKERSRPPTARHAEHLGAPAREAATRETPAREAAAPEREEHAEHRPAEHRPAERRARTRRHEGPIRTAEREAPAEVRPPTPAEERAEDLEDLDDPPWAERPAEGE